MKKTPPTIEAGVGAKANPSRELAMIDRIQDILGPAASAVLTGIGDDTAVVRGPTEPLLFCSDAMVESVHFDLNTTSPEALGYKALMACASDIAAMNGRWLYSTVSLALPASLAESSLFIEPFYQGAKRAIDKWSASLVGGDLTLSPGPIFIDVACIGSAAHPVHRGGARPGDWIAVSGTLGAAKAGFEILNSPLCQELEGHSSEIRFAELVQAHLQPEARLDLIEALSGRNGAPTSMIDISDGLASELHHLQRYSKLGFEIDLRLLPRSPLLPVAAKALGLSVDAPLHWALNGGEDYQLLATFDPSEFQKDRKPNPLPHDWTVIGKVVADPGVFALDQALRREPLAVRGFQHF